MVRVQAPPLEEGEDAQDQQWRAIYGPPMHADWLDYPKRDRGAS